jgi:hypothetical protein
MTSSSKPYLLWVFSVLAIIFGVLTIKSSYLVLFTTGEFHQAAGNYLPFVVTFNGIAGFFYIIAGLGFFKNIQWSAWLSIGLALSTLLIFMLFGWYVNEGGLYEQRTVAAMVIRSGFWVILSLIAWFSLIKKEPVG